MKPTPKQIVLWLFSSLVIMAGAAALFIFYVVPNELRDFAIHNGKGTEANAVVIGYKQAGRSSNRGNSQILYSLNLRVNSSDKGIFMADTAGAFTRSRLESMGVWNGEEREVKVSYIGTRAVVEGHQFKDVPVVMIVALIFGAFGLLSLIATIFQAVTGRQMISNELVDKLKSAEKKVTDFAQNNEHKF
ncbi:MAG: hypothetical protein FWD26_08655 [Treponema sp.]|nr:hypothetical protein [Treponema sp.]